MLSLVLRGRKADEDNVGQRCFGGDVCVCACFLCSDWKSGMLNGCFQKYWYPKMDGIIMENPIKIDDLGPTPIFGNTQMEALFCSLGAVCMKGFTPPH